MGLSNAEKQRRWRERNQINLAADAADIAEKLIDMADQRKLKKIAGYVTDHLKHPDRNPLQRAIALGRAGIGGFNGPLSKRAAIEAAADDAPPPSQTGSWCVEVTDDKGQRWHSGVRLRTKEEAEIYVEWYARHEVSGYVTAGILSSDDAANCSIIRQRKGGRPSLTFMDGECFRLRWHARQAVTVVDAILLQP